MNTVELFSGRESFSKVMREAGYNTFTVDNNPIFKSDLTKDILDLDIYKLPKDINYLWASPPCTFFSVASIGKYWNQDHTPKHPNAKLGLKILEKTIYLISELKKRNPTMFWYIENPRGKMRKVIIPLLEKYGLTNQYAHNTITYCQYGDTRMKPTDIWTNDILWKPRPMCKNGDPCHESAPRGSKTGTQGLKGNMERSVIPRDLFIEIFDLLPQEMNPK